MAPMVLVGTVLTHLFGGSAGREGTAVQMGASLADWLSHRLRLGEPLRQQLLAAGVAGGFGSVFGTPIAGAVFGLEFVVLGRRRVSTRSCPPSWRRSSGDLTTRALGIQHTAYPAAPALALDLVVLAKWVIFAIAIALASAVFIELLDAIEKARRAPAAAPRLAHVRRRRADRARLAGDRDQRLSRPGRADDRPARSSTPPCPATPSRPSSRSRS